MNHWMDIVYRLILDTIGFSVQGHYYVVDICFQALIANQWLRRRNYNTQMELFWSMLLEFYKVCYFSPISGFAWYSSECFLTPHFVFKLDWVFQYPLWMHITVLGWNHPLLSSKAVCFISFAIVSYDQYKVGIIWWFPKNSLKWSIIWMDCRLFANTCSIHFAGILMICFIWIKNSVKSTDWWFAGLYGPSCLEPSLL